MIYDETKFVDIPNVFLLNGAQLNKKMGMIKIRGRLRNMKRKRKLKVTYCTENRERQLRCSKRFTKRNVNRTTCDTWYSRSCVVRIDIMVLEYQSKILIIDSQSVSH